MIHNLEQASDRITVWTDSVTSRTYLFADLVGATAAEKAADLQARIQADLDVRTPLAGLPTDDPEKTTDPALPCLFWDGPDLVGRDVEVEATPEGGSYSVKFKNCT